MFVLHGRRPHELSDCFYHPCLAKHLRVMGSVLRRRPDGACAGSGDTAVVQQLISLGCSPTAVDRIGWSPLMWAAAGGHAGIIRELMGQAADAAVRDVRARGALHWAAEKGPC